MSEEFQDKIDAHPITEPASTDNIYKDAVVRTAFKLFKDHAPLVGAEYDARLRDYDVVGIAANTVRAGFQVRINTQNVPRYFTVKITEQV